MAAVYAFVNTPTASPTILLNLADNNLLSVVDGVSVTPPQRRVSSFGSSARDGDVVSQAAYQDRVLRIPLMFKPRSTAEQQATVIQNLGRMLDAPQWLKWQSDGKTAPVFYRTKYGDINIEDVVLNARPERYVTLTIVAEPFGYGLPVSGSVTIDNDPSSGTNKMTALLTSVQGDVATPLWLKFTQNASAWASIVSSTCLPTGTTGGVPLYTDAFDITAPASAWLTSTSAADATAVSGFRKRWTRNATVATASAYVPLSTYLANVPRGDYRLLVRVRSSSAAATITGWVSDPSLSVDLSASTKRAIPGTTWGYVDLGVVRAPGFAPRKTTLLDQGHASRTYVTFYISASQNETVDFDVMMLVPVGLDDALDTRTAIVGGDLTGTDDLYLDGVNKFSYMRVSSTDTMAPAVVVGGFPRVMPNADCHLNFVRLIGVAGDSKTLDTVVNWTYYPLYLYDRPATT